MPNRRPTLIGLTCGSEVLQSVGRNVQRPGRRQRATLPALMHEVHAFTRFGVPPTTVRTVWMFGFQRRLVRRCECEMLWPMPGPLPHTSQLAATSIHLYRVVVAAGCVRTARLRALRKSRC